ncbi:MAG: NAD(P)-dependent oxidoreductase [bacterium]|nr:NAD(P)-dependent oxidoreductase [bacterium]MCM1374871.1 NAD(P)-dependent oxidoreductase [Muribaculum sp.]
MRILITGATSMIGLSLCERLSKGNNQIIAVVRKNSLKANKLPQTDNMKIVKCDMKDYSLLSEMNIEKLDSAVLLAWNGTRGSERNNVDLQRSNYEASMTVLQQLVQMKCKSIITAGSQAEYGPWHSPEKLKETAKATPNTEYGKSKLKFYEDAKEICNANGVRLTEPRFFSLYGPNDFEGTMVISILKKMLAGESCDLTQCVQLWDFLYIDDAIEGLIKLIETQEAFGIYNFGYGEKESVSLKKYIQKMYQITNSTSVLNYGTIPYPESGIVNANPCVDKLKSLGWEPRVSFEEGIQEIIKTLKV